MPREISEQLYLRAMRIQEGKANGLWLPIMQALSNRGHLAGMLEWAHWLSDHGKQQQANQLYRRAYHRGSAHAAQNLAMNRFNANDLGGYRYWLARAAAMDAPSYKCELKRFYTRLDHVCAFKIKRGRPTYPNEGFGTRRPI